MDLIRMVAMGRLLGSSRLHPFDNAPVEPAAIGVMPAHGDKPEMSAAGRDDALCCWGVIGLLEGSDGHNRVAGSGDNERRNGISRQNDGAAGAGVVIVYVGKA